ncbi:MAG: hypothetical protein ATN35_12910 [Epulopiscium sp. Nele67-Bin004]|nr:MAG: hypothetical protein ATN35_12910 [Epulopiscium sp. Nele67-Bin004]
MKYFDEIIEIREQIHMYPEDGFLEFKTSKLVADTLRKYGVEVTENVAQTGVVGLIRGTHAGKTILLRADMDALKVGELADVPYKSRVDGMMHACGHDGHTAALLGAAMILSEMRDSLCGNVKFVFQPAEEEKGGALPMIEAGILDNPKVDIAVGAHLWGTLPRCKVQTKSGAVMASPAVFNIKVIGVGGHGALPHQTVDPTVVAAQIVLSLQTIVSRMSNPLESVVISIGQIHTGNCFNAIPNDVYIEGTVRVFDDNTGERVRVQMEQLIAGITAAYGATYEFMYRKIYPTLINDENVVNLVMESAKKVVGEKNVGVLDVPNMGGEDFSYFGLHVPSAFFFFGISESEDTPQIHHNPYFCWDSEITVELAKCMAQVAIDFLK